MERLTQDEALEVALAALKSVAEDKNARPSARVKAAERLAYYAVHGELPR
jgi:20S proteasome alpha/beta subunit